MAEYIYRPDGTTSPEVYVYLAFKLKLTERGKEVWLYVWIGADLPMPVPPAHYKAAQLDQYKSESVDDLRRQFLRNNHTFVRYGTVNDFLDAASGYMKEQGHEVPY